MNWSNKGLKTSSEIAIPFGGPIARSIYDKYDQRFDLLTIGDLQNTAPRLRRNTAIANNDQIQSVSASNITTTDDTIQSSSSSETDHESESDIDLD